MYKDKEVYIDPTAEVENTVFGIYNRVGRYCTLENVTMEDYSYCEPFCIIQNAHIGKFCDIARNVRIGATQHPLDRPTTHHMTYRRIMYDMDDIDDEDFFRKRKSKITVIEPDVWIGHGVIIEAGVRVGTGSVIGSNAVITHDVEPYSIVAGVPGRLIRMRFDKEIQRALLDMAWWDWPDELIRSRFKDFCQNDVRAFIEKYGRKKRNEE